MNLCCSGHVEICHEERICPFCEFQAEKNEEIAELEKRIEELEDELKSLK